MPSREELNATGLLTNHGISKSGELMIDICEKLENKVLEV